MALAPAITGLLTVLGPSATSPLYRCLRLRQLAVVHGRFQRTVDGRLIGPPAVMPSVGFDRMPHQCCRHPAGLVRMPGVHVGHTRAGIRNR